MALCLIRGPVTDIAGDIMPGAVITFERRGVVGQDGRAVMPVPLPVTVADDGTLAMSLFPGSYIGKVKLDGSWHNFQLGVPDEAEADLADLIAQQPELTPSLVKQAQGAATTATGAADLADRRAREAAEAATQVDGDAQAVEVARQLVEADREAVAEYRVQTGLDRERVGEDFAQTTAARQQTQELRDQTEQLIAVGMTAQKMYDTIASGRAAVSDGDQFGVIANGTDGLTRPTIYRRISATDQVFVMAAPTGAEVDKIADQVAPLSVGDGGPLLSLEDELGNVSAEIDSTRVMTETFSVGTDSAGNLIIHPRANPQARIVISPEGFTEVGGGQFIERSGDKYVFALGSDNDNLLDVDEQGVLRTFKTSVTEARVGGFDLKVDAAGMLSVATDEGVAISIARDGSMNLGGVEMSMTDGDVFSIGDGHGGDALVVTSTGEVRFSGESHGTDANAVPKREIGDYPASTLRNSGGAIIPPSGNDNYGLRRFNPFSDLDTVYVVFAFGQSLMVLSPNLARAPWFAASAFPMVVGGVSYASREDLYTAWAQQGITGLTDAEYAMLEERYYRPLSTAEKNPFPENLLMPDCGSLVNEQEFTSLVPMAEYVKVTGIGNVGGTPGTESPACRMLWKFMELMHADFPDMALPTIVLVNVARGGSTMNNVGTGRLWYNDAIRSLRKIQEIAAADGKKVSVPFYWYKGAENEFSLTRYAVPGDSSSGGLISGQDYEALLYSISRERERFDEVVKSITSQTWNVRALISQVQRGTTQISGSAALGLDPQVTQAQFDARTLPYCVFTAPHWTSPVNIYDNVHPSVVSSTHDGERHGYIAYKAMCSVEGWHPLKMNSFVRTGDTTFEVRFNRQIRFLNNDDFINVSALGAGRGLFMAQSVGGVPQIIEIASVALKPGTFDTVVVTTVAAPSGYGIYIDNALHGTGGQSYSKVGCRSAIVGMTDFGFATFHPNDPALDTPNSAASEINNLGESAVVYPAPFPLFDPSAQQRLYLKG
ncbi:hypothetical protein [Ketogulonicigenium vulgare]|uniref:hypothetical protein n=1 Tax=Ketogulonicigenium vulgare TaxID=92945 RepID=UPI002359F898|nr:hypothetical protein [Ketogulonicigenium vulgare]